MDYYRVKFEEKKNQTRVFFGRRIELRLKLKSCMIIHQGLKSTFLKFLLQILQKLGENEEKLAICDYYLNGHFWNQKSS